jgi:hypothetical protein
MALTILSGPTGLFDAPTRDQASLSKLLKLATFGQARFPTGTALASQNAATVTASLLLKDKQRQTAQNFLAKTHDFFVEASTSAAETANVIELIARGVTFPADVGAANGDRFVRDIQVDAYVTGLGATETGFLRVVGVIQGGATPTVLAVTNPGPSAVAAAGLAATPAITFVAGAGTLNIAVTSAEAEPLDWKVFVFVGKLRQVRLPAT